MSILIWPDYIRQHRRPTLSYDTEAAEKIINIYRSSSKEDMQADGDHSGEFNVILLIMLAL